MRLRPGEDRVLQVQIHVADSAEAAIRTARRGHDELTKLLWPNIIRRNPALASRPPFTLEERTASKSWIVGTPEQTRDELLEMQEELGFEALLIFPHLPGMRRAETLEQLGRFWTDVRPALAARVPTGQPVPAGARPPEEGHAEDAPPTFTTGLHGSIPPSRYWAYYTWQEIDAIAKADRNATAIINVGAVEQHGPHLPLITDTLLGMEVLGAALARLPDDVMVLALPPTTFGKSVEHITFPGTLTFSGDTLRMVLKDLAASVARSGFTKLVLLGSHGGNVGTTDDYFRDLRMETDLRVFKIFLGGIGQVAGLVAPEEAAIAMHSGDSETSIVRHLAPELVHVDRAEDYVFEPTPTSATCSRATTRSRPGGLHLSRPAPSATPTPSPPKRPG